MNPKKRGLGKGLEALLANTSLEGHGGLGAPGVTDSETQTTASANLTRTLVQTLHQERCEVLAEAEALLALIEEFEMIIRADVLGRDATTD